tara:strand:+ start:113 stop:964 length:852 start_codon:yes stop_codon:yes gene_type:complete
MVMDQSEYFLRYEHGSHRVLVSNGGDYGRGRVRRDITVEYPTGALQYRSFKGMLRSVLGKATSGLTFDRYFRTDDDVVGDPIFVEWGELLIDTVEVPPKDTGIDLSSKHMDIKRLMYSGFGKVIHYNGYDPDDVLQEIYRGILARNNGKCPFDKSKSSFGHYVHMVIGCILSNYHRKRNKWKENECKARGYDDDGSYGEIDCGELAMVDIGYCEDESYDRAKEELLAHCSDRVKKELVCYLSPVLELLSLGHTQTYIGNHLSLSRATVNKLVKKLRESTKAVL